MTPEHTVMMNYLAKLRTYDRATVAQMERELVVREVRTRSPKTRAACQLMLRCCDIHLRG